MRKSGMSRNPVHQRAALYVRVSTGAQAARDLSIPDQIRQLEAHCASEGWPVVATFKDARTGTDGNRPGFRSMIEATEGGKPPFDVIVVHSMSRFFRDEIEFELHARLLAERGVRIVSMTQDFEDSPLGDMVRRIMALFDEYDSKETGKHVARSMKENASQGFFNGGPPPFGFESVTTEVRGAARKKRLFPKQDGAETVRRIFDLYLKGDGSSGPLGVKNITEWLNDHGITTKRGARCGIGGVHKLLTDPVYKGDYWHNRKAAPEDRVLVSVPEIVSADVFDQVERSLAERNPRKTPPRVVSGPVLLTGLATCGKCGNGMLISTGKGGQYRYYACGGRIRQGHCTCEGTRVRMTETDDLVLGAVLDKRVTVPRMEKLLKDVWK